MAQSRLSSSLRLGRPACALALVLDATSVLATSAAPKTITVGTLTLTFCDQDFNGYCGSTKRVLDPTGGVKGHINVAFAYYPRCDRFRRYITRS